MSEILRRDSSTLSSWVPESFTRTESKSLTRRQNAAIAEGIVSNTRVQARGIIAATGIQLTGMLSREALFQAGEDVETYHRCASIVDAYALFVANEIRR